MWSDLYIECRLRAFLVGPMRLQDWRLLDSIKGLKYQMIADFGTNYGMDGRTSPFSKAELVYPSFAFGLYASLPV